MARYFVHAPQDGRAMGAALTPSMNRTFAGWSSRGKVYGQPGTQGVPVADPAAIRHDVNSLAAVGQFNTVNAPNVIFPALYWEADGPLEKEKFPGSIRSDNQMPIPAKRPTQVYTANPFVARKGGQRQIVQPQVVQRWLGMRGTSAG